MRRGVLALGASLFAAVAGLEVPVGARAGGPRTHEFVIQGLRYLPETLKVRHGDVVVWINKDPFAHTVTAAGAFDSGPIGAGRSWRFRARRAGSYRYVCTLHSNMAGTIEAE